jgi:hypothetical protein
MMPADTQSKLIRRRLSADDLDENLLVNGNLSEVHGVRETRLERHDQSGSRKD